MSKTGYTVVTGGAVSLAADTAKTVLGIKGHANFGLDLKKLRFGFVDTNATEAPVIVELCYCTWATNGTMGTNNTTVTPVQAYGRTTAVGAVAGKNWTSEPTVLTVLEEIPLTPNGGLLVYDYPLGDTFDCAVAEGFALRMTADEATSVRAGMLFERA